MKDEILILFEGKKHGMKKSENWKTPAMAAMAQEGEFNEIALYSCNDKDLSDQNWELDLKGTLHQQT